MTEANAAQWTGEVAMSMLVGITRDPDATEDDKAGARNEILVLMGATVGRYDIYDRARARRHLRFVIENMKTPCEPQRAKSAPVSLKGGGGTGALKGARIGKRKPR